MTIHVFIDSCAWNYLYENEVDLEKELPPDRFSIRLVREVEIELQAIPDVGGDGVDKSGLKAFIRRNIERLPVTTSYTFGFATLESDGTPSKTQVYGGFNVGTFQPKEERDFYARSEIQQQLQNGKKTKSGLGKNEADASLAAKSVLNIVLTNERMNKSGPLRVASVSGGRVIYLEDQVLPSGLKIGDFIDSLDT
ncbi:hypothetical protein KV708_19350 [Comamonas thiooxydans]|uniref:hypothetical protein n=1 Tax=Comamonas thiooxydans TaxID=363952 RepID=UPI00070A6B5C|nr:hypothetical protein [Comamonas thiooxydans]